MTNIYTLTEYLNPQYPKQYESFHLILPGTPAHSVVLLTIFAEFSCVVEKVTTLTSPVFSNAGSYHPHGNRGILT